jgi:ATP-dependent DNA helicase RecG
VELTRTLQHLTQLRMLDSRGTGRGAVYFLPGQHLPTPDDVFGSLPLPTGASSSGLPPSSSVLASSSSVLAGSSSNSRSTSSSSDQTRDEHGYLRTEQLPLPVISDLSSLSPMLRARLEGLASAPREKKKLDREVFEAAVVAVCDGHYLTLNALADLLNRKPTSLRNEYLTPMVRAKTLSLAFPTTPTHERQAYCSTSSLPAGLESKG